MNMRNALIFLGHITALALVVFATMSAYYYFLPLGFILDGIVWYFVKKLDKPKKATN